MVDQRSSQIEKIQEDLLDIGKSRNNHQTYHGFIVALCTISCLERK